jgi:hypothetical protein
MINDWFCRLDDVVGTYIRKHFQEVMAEDLGLDRRAGYRLWIHEQGIAVPKDSDGSLQYYSGFEYIDKSLRREYGDWVIYAAEDSRVQDCIDRYFDSEKDATDACDT